MIEWIKTLDRSPGESCGREKNLLVYLYGEACQGFFVNDKFWVSDDSYEIDDIEYWAELNLPE